VKIREPLARLRRSKIEWQGALMEKPAAFWRKTLPLGLFETIHGYPSPFRQFLTGPLMIETSYRQGEGFEKAEGELTSLERCKARSRLQRKYLP
jgi:hypothetical protein